MSRLNYARGPEDEKWKEVVKKVRARDGNFCRLLRRLSVQEAYILKKNSPSKLVVILDPAHIIPVSKNRAMMYDEDNIVLLNRYSHENLDFKRSPLDGKPLTENQYHDW